MIEWQKRRPVIHSTWLVDTIGWRLPLEPALHLLKSLIPRCLLKRMVLLCIIRGMSTHGSPLSSRIGYARI